MYTEEKAKTKWCAHSRTGGVMDGAVMPAANRLLIGLSADGEPVWEQSPAACACLASRCMAWRWGPIEGAGPDETVFVLGQDHPNADPAYVGATRKLRVPRGYCRLAGKP